MNCTNEDIFNFCQRFQVDIKAYTEHQKQLFGVATEHVLTMLRDHIIQLKYAITQSNGSFNQFREKLHPCGSKINKRLDNIRDGMMLHQIIE
jgi:hypothetical protein